MSRRFVRGRQRCRVDTVYDLAAARHDGLILFDDVARLGVTSRRLDRDVATGLLVRLRRGVYADAEWWHSESSDACYRLRVRAVALTRDTPLLVSHLSAAAMHGLPIVGDWPSTVHAVRVGAPGGSSSRGLTLHTGGPPPETRTLGDVTVTTLDRTLVDVAATSNLVVSVAMLDHALRLDLTSKEALCRMLDRVNPRYGAARARFAVEFATPLANRPGESMSRVRMHELGFAAPELQTVIRLPNGRTAIVDFYWPERRLAGEFDGRGKYEREEFTAGEDPGVVVWREKLREDQLRKVISGVTRWTWNIALSPAAFTRHLLEAGVRRRS